MRPLVNLAGETTDSSFSVEAYLQLLTPKLVPDPDVTDFGKTSSRSSKKSDATRTLLQGLNASMRKCFDSGLGFAPADGANAARPASPTHTITAIEHLLRMVSSSASRSETASHLDHAFACRLDRRDGGTGHELAPDPGPPLQNRPCL